MEQHQDQESIELQTAGGTTVSLPVVGIGGRSYAFLVDWHIRLLLALFWVLASLILLSGSLVPQEFGAAAKEKGFLYAGLLPALAIYFLYHPVLEVLMGGETPGKRYAGVRIVTTAGEPPSAGALIIRNVFRLIDCLPQLYVVGICCVLLTRRAVRIGDLAAGTVLVYQERVKSESIDRLMENEDAHLGPEQRELIVDLLERWKELDRKVRRRLARALLERNGARPAEEADERALRESLETLLRGEGGK